MMVNTLLDQKTDMYFTMKCPGECDGCRYKKRVPGDVDRIDREPRYYCSLIFVGKENCKDEEKSL